MAYARRHHRSGFTLVELAIVLVIMGLIVGGVLVGRDLVRAAELRSVVNEYNQYRVAVNTFREKYRGLPGDLTNATDYWGTDPGGCPSTPTNTVAKTTTCNGNGDGIIGSFAALALPDTVPFREIWRAWQQLANAGLVAGSFTGATGADGAWSLQYMVIGQNVPASRLNSAGWTFYPCDSCDIIGPTVYFPSNHRTQLRIGAIGLESTAHLIGADIFTGPEALALDTKIDDGKPAYGTIITYKSAGTCISSNTASAATYVTTDDTIRCHLYFMVN